MTPVHLTYFCSTFSMALNPGEKWPSFGGDGRGSRALPCSNFRIEKRSARVTCQSTTHHRTPPIFAVNTKSSLPRRSLLSRRTLLEFSSIPVLYSSKAIGETSFKGTKEPVILHVESLRRRTDCIGKHGSPFQV
jgi:hypothetical protein